MELIIKKLEQLDLALIPQFQPPDWSDVASRFRQHFGQAYFYPVKAVLGDTMVGIGQLMLNRDSAWLGNIIVHKDYRNQGIGKIITQHLIEAAHAFGKKLLLLLATAEGQGLYAKLGFQHESEYYFFKKENWTAFQLAEDRSIIKNDGAFHQQILKLDKAAIGEERSAILQKVLSNSWVFKNENTLEGFYLPDLGEGLIIANNENAGIRLLQFRTAKQGQIVVIPAENEIAQRFLKSEGYTLYRKACLMRIGAMKNWQSQLIFSRVGGYLG